MAILKVLNVGNGDSMIITPPSEEEKIIFIDLGSNNSNSMALQHIIQNLNGNNHTHVFITHSHADHIGGMDIFIIENKINEIKEFTVPFYQNEIVMIANIILNLKGIQHTHDCENLIHLMREIIQRQVQLKNIIQSSNSTALSFAYEGRIFYNSIECLNPPKIIKTYNWLQNLSHDLMSSIVNELFEPEFASNLLNYIENSNMDNQVFYDIILNGNSDFSDEELYEINYNKRLYILDFIMTNMRLLAEFNTMPRREYLLKIYNNFVKNVHDSCIVMKANYVGKKFLLTGDASKKVFNRLIRARVDIHADYLKMPHHGSTYNITKKILNAISPDVAIISHGNLYGHPHLDVIEMLTRMDVRIMLTNDVVKDDVIHIQKIDHLGDNIVDIF